MARKLTTDKVLFVPLVALSLFGCIMIYSASAVSSAETAGSPYRYLIKQIAALLVGGVAAFVVSRTDYRNFARPWVFYAGYGAAFALCAFALLQPPINAARRWIPLGPVMFQPSEFLKVALVVLLAAQIARKTLAWGDPHKAIKPALFFTLAAAGIVMVEPDLGTAACYVMLVASPAVDRGRAGEALPHPRGRVRFRSWRSPRFPRTTAARGCSRSSGRRPTLWAPGSRRCSR